MTIDQSNNDSIPKSSSVDDSQFSQYRSKHNFQNEQNSSIITTTTTTTSSSGILNDQQSLLKQSSRKCSQISNPNSTHSSYRRTLLQALNPTTNNLSQISPIKKLSKIIHFTENNFCSSKGTITSESKYSIFARKMEFFFI